MFGLRSGEALKLIVITQESERNETYMESESLGAGECRAEEGVLEEDGLSKLVHIVSSAEGCGELCDVEEREGSARRASCNESRSALMLFVCSTVRLGLKLTGGVAAGDGGDVRVGRAVGVLVVRVAVDVVDAASRGVAVLHLSRSL